MIQTAERLQTFPSEAHFSQLVIPFLTHIRNQLPITSESEKAQRELVGVYSLVNRKGQYENVRVIFFNTYTATLDRLTQILAQQPLTTIQCPIVDDEGRTVTESGTAEKTADTLVQSLNAVHSQYFKASFAKAEKGYIIILELL